MKRLLVMLAFLGFAKTGFCANPLKFHLTKGWLDTSPGVPDSTLSRLSPDLIKELQRPGTVFSALYLESKSQQLMSNLQVIYQDVQIVVTDDVVKAQAEGIKTRMLEKHPKWTAKIDSTSVVKINGVSCGRMVYSFVKSDGIPSVEMGFILPAGEKTALMDFSCYGPSFKEEEKIFDEVARATEGIHAGSALSDRGLPAPVGPARLLSADAPVFDIIDPVVQAVTAAATPRIQESISLASTLLRPR